MALVALTGACGDGGSDLGNSKQLSAFGPEPQGQRIDLAQSPDAVQTPPGEYRPSFRWWWPRCDLDRDEVRAGIDAMQAAGFGSAEQILIGITELTPLHERLGLAGNNVELFIRSLFPDQVVPDESCWFSEGFREELAAVLGYALDRHFELDVTMGPSWPPTSLATTGDLAIQALVVGFQPLVGGVPYVGLLPPALPGVNGGITTPQNGVGTPLDDVLVGVSAMKVLEPGVPVILDPESAIDLTDQVSNGTVSWQPPDPGAAWMLFAYYRRPTQGLILDPFSRTATDAATADYDATTFGGPVGPLLAEHAGDLFVDSFEYSAGAGLTTLWTAEMFDAFKSRRGYDLRPYAAALFIPNQHFSPLVSSVNTIPPAFDFPADLGHRLRADYYQTLTELHIDNHIEPLTDYAHTLGMRLAIQPCYGSTLAVVRCAVKSERVQHETLYAIDPGDNYGVDGSRLALDHYREVVSGAHISGNSAVVGVELGADIMRDHELTIDWYKAQGDRSFAGGINRVLVHGMNVADRDNVPWPGYHAFPGLFAEPWTPDSPMLAAFRGLTDYWTRAAAALQNGKPSMDLAIYRLDYSSYEDKSIPILDGASLQRNGYTWDLVDPFTLTEIGRTEQRQLIIGEGRYKALVIVLEGRGPATRNALSAEVAEHILSLSRRGVPVIFVGEGTPRGAGFADAAEGDVRVATAVTTAEAAPNVRRVASEAELPEALQSLGVVPDFQLAEPANVLPVHRVTPSGDVWFLFNDSAQPVSTTARFLTRGSPTEIDLWNGDANPVAQWNPVAGGAEVKIDLDVGETMLLGFGTAANGFVRVVETTAEKVRIENGQLLIEDTRPGTHETKFSDGRSVSLEVPGLPASQQLNEWRLQVDGHGVSGDVSYDAEQDGLSDWRSIPELETVSGVGTYTTSFELPADWTSPTRGVRLDIGEAAGAIEVTLNGQIVTSQVTDGWQASITDLLRPGTNELKVVIGTNRINTMVALSRTNPDPYYRLWTARQTQSYGLLGPVELVPVAVTGVDAKER